VQSIGAGPGAEFSLLPAQNATGNWIKIVQRIPVRVELDPKQLVEHPLRLGMSMSVDVSVRDQDGPVLPAASAREPVLATQAYAKQLKDADALIHDIITKHLPQGGKA